MPSMEKKSLNAPDETRSVNKGKIDLVKMGGVTFSRITFEPGWKWSVSVKPIAKTDSCQVHHVGYVVAGRMRVKLDNGEELEIGPNDAYDIPPGHDAWIVGNETYIGVDVSGGMSEYAKR